MGREVDVATRQPTVMQSRCRSPPGLSAWKNAPQRVFVVRDSRCSRVNGKSMRVVDCFSASSGLSCGLPCTGAEVVLRIGCREKLPAACPTKLPHPMAQLDARDVALVSQTIRGVTPIDALIGAPPCDCSGDRVRGASLIVCIARVRVSLRPRCMLIQSATRTLCDADREAERLLVAAGYRVVELRLCAAACGLPLLQRCLFLLAVRDCDPALVQQVEREAEAYSRVPPKPRTVRECLATRPKTYYLPTRSRHARMVRCADEPAPSLSKVCLSLPPSQYTRRHDDAGPLSKAHVLSIGEAAALASYPPGYFDGFDRSEAGRMIGSSAPPAVWALAAAWCRRLVASPVVEGVVTPQRHVVPRSCYRRSRIEKLLVAGFLDHGAEMDGNALRYVCGHTDRGDALVEHVLGWCPPLGWVMLLRGRSGASRSLTSAPLDDLSLTQPGVGQPYRSCGQAIRSLERAGHRA